MQNINIEFHLVSPFFSKVNFLLSSPLRLNPATAGGRGRTTWANLEDQSDAPRRVNPRLPVVFSKVKLWWKIASDWESLKIWVKHYWSKFRWFFFFFRKSSIFVAQKSQRFHRKMGKITNIAENRLGKQPEKSPSDVFRKIGNSQIGDGS